MNVSGAQPTAHGAISVTTARELAHALRVELEARLSVLPPAPEVADCLPQGVRATLTTHARVCDHPPAARPGLLAPLVRGLRAIFRGFLRPWLEFQTNYNEAAAESLLALHAGLAETRRELAALKADLGIGHWLADPCLARSNLLLTLRNELDLVRSELAALSAGAATGTTPAASSPVAESP